MADAIEFQGLGILFKDDKIAFGDESCECCDCFELHPPACLSGCRQDCGFYTPIYHFNLGGHNEHAFMPNAPGGGAWFINFPNGPVYNSYPSEDYDIDDPIYDYHSAFWTGTFFARDYGDGWCQYEGPGVGSASPTTNIGSNPIWGLSDHDPAPGESVGTLFGSLTIALIKTPGHVRALAYSAHFGIGFGGTWTGAIRLYFDCTIDVTDPIDCFDELIFPANDLSDTITVYAAAEQTYLPANTETRDVVAGGGTGWLHIRRAICPCDNNHLSVTDVSILEGDTSTTMIVTVVRERPDGTVTVDYTTSAVTATSGVDYDPTSGTLTFTGEERIKTISIPIHGDTTIEADETFTVVLSNASDNATITDDTGTETIVDDDTPPDVAIANASAVEGDTSGTNTVSFPVTRSSGYKTTTVTYATADGTATAGVDYVATTGTLTFNPGQVTKNIIVSIIGDTTPEANETFTVTITDGTFSHVVVPTATATITNDDYCWYKWRQIYDCDTGTWGSVTQFDVLSGATNPFSGAEDTWFLDGGTETTCDYFYYTRVLSTTPCADHWPTAPAAQTETPLDTCTCAVLYCWYRFEQNYQCDPAGWYAVSQESYIASNANPFPESEGSWQQYVDDGALCGYHYVVRGPVTTDGSDCVDNWPENPTALSGTPGSCVNCS